MDGARSLYVRSTSRSSAVCGDVVLREKDTTRLIFRPELIDNPHDADNSVKGTFIFQRKSKNDRWEDLTGEKLSQLKAGEGYKLELSSAALKVFFEAIGQCYAFHRDQGIPRGEVEYTVTSKNITPIIKQLLGEPSNIQKLIEEGAADLLSPYVEWFIGLANRERVFEVLRKLDQSALADIESVARLSALKRIRDEWTRYYSNSDEHFWQSFLKKHPWIFSQVFSYPVILHTSGAYVGGKTIDNSGGKIVDFLFANSITNNSVLIEIKTPTTPLLGKQYRNDIYPLSSEVSGAVAQLSNYKNTLIENAYNTLRDGTMKPHAPKTLLIAGSTRELDSQDKIRSFELGRGELRSIELITFDELFKKVDGLIMIFSERPDEEFHF